MTVDEMIGAIKAMQLSMGWHQPTPETEQLKADALAVVDSIQARVMAANDMRTMKRLQRELDAVMPTYYRKLAALKQGNAQ